VSRRLRQTGPKSRAVAYDKLALKRRTVAYLREFYLFFNKLYKIFRNQLVEND